MESTVKMMFFKDAFYTDPEVPLYSKGIHEVPANMAGRWAKRGAVLVSELTDLKAVTLPTGPNSYLETEEKDEEETSEKGSKKTKSRR